MKTLMQKAQTCNLPIIGFDTGIWSVCFASIVSGVWDIYLLFEKWGAYILTEIANWYGTCKMKKYTRIRGEWYDLQSFKHPGGPIAISLIVGRDGTALFESHHYFIDHDRLQRILSKYRVKKEIADTLSTMDPMDDGSSFDWKEYDNSPFVKEIKAMVKDHFSRRAKKLGITVRQATKATPKRWALLVFLMSLFLSTIPSYVSGKYWTLIVTPFLGWLWAVNWWHDALHFGLSCDWRVNAFLPYLFPLFSSPWSWYHQHVIGHHAYTNIGHRDPDLWNSNPLIKRFNKWQKLTKWGVRQKNLVKFSLGSFVFSVAVPLGLNMIRDLIANITGKYKKAVAYTTLRGTRLVAHIFGRFLFVYIVFIWPFLYLTPRKAIIWATFPIVIFSWFFMLNTQINHCTENTAYARGTNFLKHQVITAQNFGVGDCGVWSGWYFLLSGGLNYQIEHHLFPSVNHCHLPDLQPKVKAICKKHGVNYNQASGYIEALGDFVKYFDNIGHEE